MSFIRAVNHMTTFIITFFFLLVKNNWERKRKR